jgi:hypothetical protein
VIIEQRDPCAALARLCGSWDLVNTRKLVKMKEYPEMARYERLAGEIASVLQIKNAAYGNAFAKTTEILKLLYPNGIPLTSYDDVHVIVRVLDKLSRIARNNDPLGEDPWSDICGYSILAQVQREKKRHDSKEDKESST